MKLLLSGALLWEGFQPRLVAPRLPSGLKPLPQGVL